MPTDHHRNFRLRGITARYETRIDVRELVKGVLSIETGASVIIHSLVDNPIEPDSQFDISYDGMVHHIVLYDAADSKRPNITFRNEPWESYIPRAELAVVSTTNPNSTTGPSPTHPGQILKLRKRFPRN